jgi:hypothetical protein
MYLKLSHCSHPLTFLLPSPKQFYDMLTHLPPSLETKPLPFLPLPLSRSCTFHFRVYLESSPTIASSISHTHSQNGYNLFVQLKKRKERKDVLKSCDQVLKSSLQQVSTRVNDGLHMMIMKNIDFKPRKLLPRNPPLFPLLKIICIGCLMQIVNKCLYEILPCKNL